MEPLLLSFLARHQVLRAPGNAPSSGKRLFAVAESGPPPQSGSPQRHQHKFSGMGGTIKCLHQPSWAHSSVGHCPFVVPVETAKATEGRFHSGSFHFSRRCSPLPANLPAHPVSTALLSPLPHRVPPSQPYPQQSPPSRRPGRCPSELAPAPTMTPKPAL